MPCRSESRSASHFPPQTPASHSLFKSWHQPVGKELDRWPEITREAELSCSKRAAYPQTPACPLQPFLLGNRMTRKHRTRKEETKDTKGGYCEMCNTDYADVMVHRRSPHHLAFVRDANNFRSLDALIQSSGDVSTFLEKNSPINGERRSQRKLCNGDAEHIKLEVTTNGGNSPRANGLQEVRTPRSGRCRKSSTSEDRQYYKVIGVNTKLRSSGTFATQRRDSPPPSCNGGSPSLVVKFRKVRRSELSVLSDEAEQFMFPRRASCSSSQDTDEDEDEPPITFERRRSTRPTVKVESPEESRLSSERRRSARPTALKEESSEDDSFHEDMQRRRKRCPPKKSRLALIAPSPKLELPEPVASPPPQVEETPTPQEVKERCLKWEDGRLKATPAVEELQFSFESVPVSEPWFETFIRQDQNKSVAKNVTKVFALYSTSSPKLPYELGQLPPLKPNCCPLSDLVKREDKGAGPSKSYGTRGNKMQKIRNRTAAALIASEKHPRKSPREHASTLAILGGLLHRRKNNDDAKSTASEDTCSETNSNVKVDVAAASEPSEQSERLQQFLSEVFEEAAEYEIPEETMDGEATVATASVPDVVELVSECENCDIIRNEVKEGVVNRTTGPGRRVYKFKKKNRTGWPNKKKCVARVASADTLKFEPSGDKVDMCNSMEGSTHDSASELDELTMASVDDELAVSEQATSRSERRGTCTETEGSTEEGGSDIGWGAAALQPVVRVAKIDTAISRRLRSAGAATVCKGRARRARAYRFR